MEKLLSCVRRHVVNLHRISYSEANLCWDPATLTYRSRPQKQNFLLLRSQLCRHYSSSTPTSVPPPPPPPEVEEKPKLKRKTVWERYKAFKPAHFKNPDDKQERITEMMIHEAAYSKSEVPMTFQEKVQETVKTSTYAGIMLIGFCVLASIGYAIYQELFNRDSPNNIYSKTFKIIKNNTEVQDALGPPLTCHGEETSRGWRRHVMHVTFTAPDGSQRMRMKYYVKGRFRNGIVFLEKQANEKGRFDKYNYLIVELSGYPPRQISIDTESL